MWGLGPPQVFSFCSASHCPRLPAFHHHWLLQSGTTLNVPFWIYFSKTRIEITVAWLHSANWPLLSMTSMVWGWTNWRWKGGLGWGQGKLAWPGAQCRAQLGRGERVWGPQVAVCKVTFSLWKKIGLSHFSASLVQAPAATWYFSLMRKQGCAKSLADSNAGETVPRDVHAQENKYL